MINKSLKIFTLILALTFAVSAGTYLYNAYLPEITYALMPVELRDKVTPDANLYQKPINDSIEPTTGVVAGAKITTTLAPSATPTPLPKDNRIVIPQINVNAAITEGNNPSALDRGMWRRPNTSTPDKGGNTVITGHRVLRTSGPNTFYFLNKLAKNDEVFIYWKGKEYIYEVFSIQVVNPDNVGVESNTKDAIVTLYTCTPAWTSQYRLVVKAKLQQ